MQISNGFYRWLETGWIYDAFQRLVGSHGARKWLAKTFWKCREGDRVLDIGCGTGDSLEYMPVNIEYTGFDINEKYICTARQKFGERAKFMVSNTQDFPGQVGKEFKAPDLILCNALLHHLNDDEVIHILSFARDCMKPTSRLICFENCLLVHQTWLSSWLIRKDRGQNLRTEQEWKRLFSQVFKNYSTNVATGLLRMPYVNIIIECAI